MLYVGAMNPHAGSDAQLPKTYVLLNQPTTTTNVSAPRVNRPMSSPHSIAVASDLPLSWTATDHPSQKFRQLLQKIGLLSAAKISRSGCRHAAILSLKGNVLLSLVTE